MNDPFAVVGPSYDRFAPRYDRWASTVEPPIRERAIDRLRALVPDGRRLLELGCGTGQPVARALSETHEYVGLDLSTGMLARARRNAPTARFVRADVRALPVARGFAGALALYSLFHVPVAEQGAVLEGVAGVLEPGAPLVLVTGTGDLAEDLEPDWQGAGPMAWSNQPPHRTVALVADAGFVVDECEVVAGVEDDRPCQCLWIVAVR